MHDGRRRQRATCTVPEDYGFDPVIGMLVASSTEKRRASESRRVVLASSALPLPQSRPSAPMP